VVAGFARWAIKCVVAVFACGENGRVVEALIPDRARPHALDNSATRCVETSPGAISMKSVAPSPTEDI
jgi:hypothetical protein